MTVIGYVGKDKNQARVWKCKCSCGKFFEAITSKIKRGIVKGCGCHTGSPADLVGKRFGKQLVISLSPRKNHKVILWECLCDCGKKTYRTTGKLLSGATISCGCSREGPRQDLTGRVFGRLTVVSLKGKNKQGNYVWQCVCSCGNTHVVSACQLLAKNRATKSCGCYYRDSRTRLRLPPGESSFNSIYIIYRSHAFKSGRVFSLTKDFFRDITKKSCFYCGSEPAQSRKMKKTSIPYVYNGLDRVDNTKGYSIDNVVPCCKTCNFMKKNLPKADFIEHVHKISNHLKGGVCARFS